MKKFIKLMTLTVVALATVVQQPVMAGRDARKPHGSDRKTSKRCVQPEKGGAAGVTVKNGRDGGLYVNGRRVSRKKVEEALNNPCVHAVLQGELGDQTQIQHTRSKSLMHEKVEQSNGNYRLIKIGAAVLVVAVVAAVAWWYLAPAATVAAANAPVSVGCTVWEGASSAANAVSAMSTACAPFGSSSVQVVAPAIPVANAAFVAQNVVPAAPVANAVVGNFATGNYCTQNPGGLLAPLHRFNTWAGSLFQ